MSDMEKNNTHIEVVCKDLFNFAIDRGDVVRIMALLPESSDARRATVEHELQILKIISVGWSLSYYLADSPLKKELTALFWREIHDFSKSLSRTTALLIHQSTDFFDTVRNRFDLYLEKLQQKADAPEPAAVIGPAFAGCCGDAGDIHAVMAGSRMFIGTVSGIKAYLEAVRLR